MGTVRLGVAPTTISIEEDTMASAVERPVGDATIRPFRIEIPEADLDDLRARIDGLDRKSVV